jgi:hypothetical protein
MGRRATRHKPGNLPKDENIKVFGRKTIVL